MALLDDPAARERLIEALARGTLDAAAAEIGISRRAVSKYADRHPEFKVRLDAVRMRRDVVTDRLPDAAAPPRKAAKVGQAQTAAVLGVPVELVRDADAEAVDVDRGRSVEDLLDLLWDAAGDRDHKGSGRALAILAEYKLGPLVRAQQRAEQRAAEREASSGETSLVIVRIPANGTEAPGREPAYLDVEVLE